MRIFNLKLYKCNLKDAESTTKDFTVNYPYGNDGIDYSIDHIGLFKTKSNAQEYALKLIKKDKWYKNTFMISIEESEFHPSDFESIDHRFNYYTI